jgi:hypothetical protein
MTNYNDWRAFVGFASSSTTGIRTARRVRSPIPSPPPTEAGFSTPHVISSLQTIVLRANRLTPLARRGVVGTRHPLVMITDCAHYLAGVRHVEPMSVGDAGRLAREGSGLVWLASSDPVRMSWTNWGRLFDLPGRAVEKRGRADQRRRAVKVAASVLTADPGKRVTSVPSWTRARSWSSRRCATTRPSRRSRSGSSTSSSGRAIRTQSAGRYRPPHRCTRAPR